MWWHGLRARSAAWGKAGSSGLKAFSPYAWLPILTVGVVSAAFSYRNFSLQQSGNRPEMIFVRAEMFDPYDTGMFSIGMQNVGSRTAYDYRLVIKSVELSSGKSVTLETVNGSNPIRRQGGISGTPNLDMKKFLDVLALCTTYRDEDDTLFEDTVFFTFPTMTRGLTKDGSFEQSVGQDDRTPLPSAVLRKVQMDI